VATLQPEPTQHNSLDRPPDKQVAFNHIIVYVSGYTETDTTGMLSPNNGRLSGANKVGLFGADSLVRHLLQCAWVSGVVATDKTYLFDASLGQKTQNLP